MKKLHPDDKELLKLFGWLYFWIIAGVGVWSGVWIFCRRVLEIPF